MSDERMRDTPGTTPPARDTATPTGGQDRRLLALALIVIGVLALLGTLGVAPALSTFVGVTLFVVVGVVAVSVARRTGNDWVLAGAFPAFGLALAVLLNEPWGGAAFLLSIGAGFLSLYVSDRTRWWSVIPTGVLFTLGIIAATDRPGGTDSGVVFFLGLALTFAALWRLPDHPQGWAIYPAAALGFMALLVASTTGSWVLPVLLIAAGVALLLRSRGPASSP
jgi:hypothetical protein